MFDISFEVSKTFEEELNATTCVPVFDTLFQALAEDIYVLFEVIPSVRVCLSSLPWACKPIHSPLGSHIPL